MAAASPEHKRAAISDSDPVAVKADCVYLLYKLENKDGGGLSMRLAQRAE